MSRKVLFKFLLVSLKTLTNSGYFTGSLIRIPQRDFGASVQPLKIPTVNHLPNMKSNTIITRFKILKSSPAYGIVYRIIGGFLYAATSSLKRVTDFHNY
jgi:hypothetical protein